MWHDKFGIARGLAGSLKNNDICSEEDLIEAIYTGRILRVRGVGERRLMNMMIKLNLTQNDLFKRIEWCKKYHFQVYIMEGLIRGDVKSEEQFKNLIFTGKIFECTKITRSFLIKDVLPKIGLNEEYIASKIEEDPIAEGPSKDDFRLFLKIPMRAYNALKKYGCKTVEDVEFVVDTSNKIHLRNFGEKSREYVIEAIVKYKKYWNFW